jgi:hypothetical protein
MNDRCQQICISIRTYILSSNVMAQRNLTGCMRILIGSLDQCGGERNKWLVKEATGAALIGPQER